jgi:hypothetical protein
MKWFSLIAAVGVLVIVGLIAAHRRDAHDQHVEGGVYTVGGIYSIRDERGFSVVKILALDPDIVHVRMYKNKFESRPSQVNVASLVLGSIQDPDGFGIGHMPVARNTFNNWAPVLMTRTAVTEDELVGYEEWKKSGGGAFGSQQ